MPQYKLHYFNLYGRAEPIRMLFFLADQPYEDRRWEIPEWPEVKKDPVFVFGQAPVLEVDGKPLPQTLAITRYLARKFGYSASDEFDNARMDAICDSYTDYVDKIVPWYRIHLKFFPGDEEFDTTVDPARKLWLGQLADLLEKEGTGYMVGDKLSWVDLTLVNHMDVFELAIPGYTKEWPTLVDYRNRVNGLPKMKEYYAQRQTCQR
ncbi:unnamed protein product, partial [Mesorhabditis spiculigera]